MVNKTRTWANFKVQRGLAHGEFTSLKNMLHIETGILVLLFIESYMGNFKSYAVMIAAPVIIVYEVLIWLAGRRADKKLRLLQAYISASNERNPEIQEILMILRRLDHASV